MSPKALLIRSTAEDTLAETSMKHNGSDSGYSIEQPVRIQTHSGRSFRAAGEAADADAIETRFWSKVNKTETCWLWTASVSGSRGVQHGQFTYTPRGGKQAHVKAHRYSWELVHGTIPNGLKICHRCDVPRCVRPDHLFLGTQHDNLTDARNKGRLRHPRHWAKVSDEDVVAIRAAYRPRRNGRALAAQYGISLPHLVRLATGWYRRQLFQEFPQAVTPKPQQPLRPSHGAGFTLEPVTYRQVRIVGEVR